MGVWVALSCGSAPIGQVYWFRNRFYITFFLEYPLYYLNSVSSNPTSAQMCRVSLVFQFPDDEVFIPQMSFLTPSHSRLVGSIESPFYRWGRTAHKEPVAQTFNLMGHQF